MMPGQSKKKGWALFCLPEQVVPPITVDQVPVAKQVLVGEPDQEWKNHGRRKENRRSHGGKDSSTGKRSEPEDPRNQGFRGKGHGFFFVSRLDPLSCHVKFTLKAHFTRTQDIFTHFSTQLVVDVLFFQRKSDLPSSSSLPRNFQWPTCYECNP